MFKNVWVFFLVRTMKVNCNHDLFKT